MSICSPSEFFSRTRSPARHTHIHPHTAHCHFSREWFFLLSHELFSPRRGFFEFSDTQSYLLRISAPKTAETESKAEGVCVAPCFVCVDVCTRVRAYARVHACEMCVLVRTNGMSGDYFFFVFFFVHRREALPKWGARPLT